MASELFTTWGDYQTAVDRVLATAQRQMSIFDIDLAQLKLETPARNECLRQFLRANPQNRLQIIVRQPDLLRNHSPRLMELLAQYSERMEMIEISDKLLHLRDGMLLADHADGLIRFDQDHARSKLITADPEALIPYRQRFVEIWNEGGTPISATTLGL